MSPTGLEARLASFIYFRNWLSDHFNKRFSLIIHFDFFANHFFSWTRIYHKIILRSESHFQPLSNRGSFISAIQIILKFLLKKRKKPPSKNTIAWEHCMKIPSHWSLRRIYAKKLRYVLGFDITKNVHSSFGKSSFGKIYSGIRWSIAGRGSVRACPRPWCWWKLGLCYQHVWNCCWRRYSSYKIMVWWNWRLRLWQSSVWL